MQQMTQESSRHIEDPVLFALRREQKGLTVSTQLNRRKRRDTAPHACSKGCHAAAGNCPPYDQSFCALPERQCGHPTQTVRNSERDGQNREAGAEQGSSEVAGTSVLRRAWDLGFTTNSHFTHQCQG